MSFNLSKKIFTEIVCHIRRYHTKAIEIYGVDFSITLCTDHGLNRFLRLILQFSSYFEVISGARILYSNLLIVYTLLAIFNILYKVHTKSLF